MQSNSEIIGERAKRARHYQGCTNSSWWGIYMYIYIYMYGGTCAIIVGMPRYVMWAELGHYHFLYMPAVLNIVTTGNGTGTKNVLKWNRALGFEFSIHPFFCLRCYYCSESKPILYQDTVYCKFLLYVCVEIDRLAVNKHWQFSTQTDFPYLGLVNISMITGVYS